MIDGPPPSWYDPPATKCKPECNCHDCHLWHLDGETFIDNALESPLDFQCCVQELEERVEEGLLCSKHPKAYFEPEYNYCEMCDEIKEKNKSEISKV